jgi:hypothetical protein
MFIARAASSAMVRPTYLAADNACFKLFDWTAALIASRRS